MNLSEDLGLALFEDSSEWKVVSVKVNTRSTRRTMRLGGTTSDGKGFREAWQIEGPWVPGNSYHTGIKSVQYKRKSDALAQAEKLAQGAK